MAVNGLILSLRGGEYGLFLCWASVSNSSTPHASSVIEDKTVYGSHWALATADAELMSHLAADSCIPELLRPEGSAIAAGHA